MRSQHTSLMIKRLLSLCLLLPLCGSAGVAAIPTAVIIETNTPAGVIHWTGPTNGFFDVQLGRNMNGTQQWQSVQALLPASATGNNHWSSPELWDDPDLPGNSNLFYRVIHISDYTSTISVHLDTVASGLVSPVHLTHAGDGSGRLFVMDQIGTVRVIDAQGALSSTNFLDVSGDMVSLNGGYDERGLLGFTFHPDFPLNPRCYVYFSAPRSGNTGDHDSLVREYQLSADPNQVDPTSGRDLLRFNQPRSNHNGGMLAFGPDGYLYIATGDGGGAGDSFGATGNAQNLSNLLGKLLRIDVSPTNSYAIPPDNPFIDTPGAAPEIYCYGLRNPYRFSFDRGGERRLFLPDIGQNLWEEVNIGAKGGNYGWRIAEGHHAFDLPLASTLSVDLSQLQWPIHEYVHGPLGISLTPGYVYRGGLIPALDGMYLFGDFSTSFGSADGALYALEELEHGTWIRRELRLLPNHTRLNRYVKGFGEDESGAVYVLSTANAGPSGATGTVQRFR